MVKHWDKEMKRYKCKLFTNWRETIKDCRVYLSKSEDTIHLQIWLFNLSMPHMHTSFYIDFTLLYSSSN